MGRLGGGLKRGRWALPEPRQMSSLVHITAHFVEVGHLGAGPQPRPSARPPGGDPTLATCVRPDPPIALTGFLSGLYSAICSRYRATSSGARLAG